MKYLLLILLFVAVFYAWASETVDMGPAKPIAQGGIQITADADQTYMGRSSPVASWVRLGSKWTNFGRTSTDYVIATSDTDVITPSFWGGYYYAREYDGTGRRDSVTVNLWDSTCVANHTVWMFEAIIKVDQDEEGLVFLFHQANTSGDSGVSIVIHTDGTLRVLYDDASAANRLDLYSANDITDGKYHVIRTIHEADSAHLYVDGEAAVTDQDASHTRAKLCADSVAMYIGARMNDDMYGYFDCPYFAIWGLDAWPSDADIDTLYNTVSDYIDGTENFVSIQTALDWMGLTTGTDTVIVNPGVFYEGVVAADSAGTKSSFMIDGVDPEYSIIDGDSLLSGMAGIEVNNVDNCEIKDITIRDVVDSTPGIKMTVAGDLFVDNVNLTDNSLGINATALDNGDTVDINNCTANANEGGFQLGAGNNAGTRMIVTSSLLTNNTTTGVKETTGGMELEQCAFYNNTADTIGAITATLTLDCWGNPLTTNNMTRWNAVADTNAVPYRLRDEVDAGSSFIGYKLGPRNAGNWNAFNWHRSKW